MFGRAQQASRSLQMIAESYARVRSAYKYMMVTKVSGRLIDSMSSCLDIRAYVVGNPNLRLDPGD